MRETQTDSFTTYWQGNEGLRLTASQQTGEAMRETKTDSFTTDWQSNEGDSNQRHYSKQCSGAVSAQIVSFTTDWQG